MDAVYDDAIMFRRLHLEHPDDLRHDSISYDLRKIWLEDFDVDMIRVVGAPCMMKHLLHGNFLHCFGKFKTPSKNDPNFGHFCILGEPWQLWVNNKYLARFREVVRDHIAHYPLSYNGNNPFPLNHRIPSRKLITMLEEAGIESLVAYSYAMKCDLQDAADSIALFRKGDPSCQYRYDIGYYINSATPTEGPSLVIGAYNEEAARRQVAYNTFFDCLFILFFRTLTFELL